VDVDVYAMHSKTMQCLEVQLYTLCTSVVLPTAIYAGETWKSVAETRNFFDIFMQERFTKYPGNVVERSRDQRPLIAKSKARESTLH